jgi:thiol-disulfide isomerase/thioredoxin
VRVTTPVSEKPLTILVLILLLIAVTFYLRSESGVQALSTTSPGTTVDDFGPAPDLSMPIGPRGKRIDLSSLHGHVVMVDFWATWCDPCKLSIPELERLYKKYKPEGLEVIGVSVDDPTVRHEVDTTAESLGITYPVTMINEIPDCKVKYPFASIPLLIIIDRTGKIRAHVSGYEPGGSNEELVTKLLKEK